MFFRSFPAVLLLAAALPQASSAGTSLGFQPSATVVQPGASFTVTLNLAYDPADGPVVAYDLQATANAASVFSIIGQTHPTTVGTTYVASSTAYQVAPLSGVPVDIGAYNGDSNGVSASGTLRTLTFRVNAATTPGIYNLTFGFAGGGPVITHFNKNGTAVPTGTLIGAPVTLTINVGNVTPPAGFSQWALENSLDTSSPANDTDGDGVPDIGEYAMGRNPRSSDPVNSAMADGNLTLTFPRLLSRSDVAVAVEGSGNLQTWGPVADQLIDTLGDVETRRASVPVGTEPFFLRFRFTR